MTRYDDTPLYGEYDVLVAGGGTAGFAAAVAAAEAGAKTLIVEKNAYLGGTATGGMISQFMGFAKGETAESQRGIFGRLLRKLMDEGASSGLQTIYLTGRRDMDVGAVPYDSVALKTILDDMVAESGAEVLFHTGVVGLSMKDGKIDYLIVHNLQGLQRVKAKVYIDATFHGSVAVDAGCPWTVGGDRGEVQPGTLMYRMVGVDMEKYAALSEDERRALARRGIAEGRMFVNNLLARELPDGTVYSNMSRIPVNPLDIKSLSEAERAARSQIRNISSFFREEVPGFENARVVSFGEFLGLRDSRRILGQYVLTKEDIVAGTEFSDTVASSSYPIDIHDTDGVSSLLVKPATGVFHVPFRTLTGDVPNLLVAGRCISADAEAHACVRVMVTCIRVGEAAGLGAWESIVRGVDVNRLDGSMVAEKIRMRMP